MPEWDFAQLHLVVFLEEMAMIRVRKGSHNVLTPIPVHPYPDGLESYKVLPGKYQSRPASPQAHVTHPEHLALELAKASGKQQPMESTCLCLS